MIEQRKRKADLIMVLLVLNLMATAVMGVYLLSASWKANTGNGESGLSAFMQTDGKYTLYIGTNDKDTYTQLISTKEAREMVNEICARYVEGYTASEAVGGWVDETGTLTQEHTLVYTLSGVTNEQVQSVMDEVLRALNQNTILVEYEAVQTVYYGGRGEPPGE